MSMQYSLPVFPAGKSSAVDGVYAICVAAMRRASVVMSVVKSAQGSVPSSPEIVVTSLVHALQAPAD